MLRLVTLIFILGLVLGVQGTPTQYVAVPPHPDASERERAARDFLGARAVDLRGYTARQTMVEWERPTLYLQHRWGAAQVARRATPDRLPLFYWQVHFTRPDEIRQYWVRIELSGRVGASVTRLAEEHPGGHQTIAFARAAALPALAASGVVTSGLAEVEAHTEVLPERTDHKLVFARDVVGATQAQERHSVSVAGTQVVGTRSWVKVPESFDQEMDVEDTYGDVLFWVSVTADSVLVVAALAVLAGVWPRRREDAALEAAASSTGLAGPLVVRAALLVFVVLAAAAANYLPVIAARRYSPPRPMWAFLLSEFLTLVMMGALPACATALMLAAGSRLDAQEGSGRTRTFGLWLQGQWSHPDVLRSMGLGLIWALAMGGGECLFYHLGGRFGPVTLPVSVAWVNSMATPAPWMYPLCIGVGAAITEECSFRLFGVTLVQRVTGRTWLALLLPACAWAFAHSKESVYPVWARGSELVLGGVLLGAWFRASDLLAVMTAHYLYDVVVFGWPLLTAADGSARLGAGLVLLVVAVPAVRGLPRAFTSRDRT